MAVHFSVSDFGCVDRVDRGYYTPGVDYLDGSRQLDKDEDRHIQTGSKIRRSDTRSECEMGCSDNLAYISFVGATAGLFSVTSKRKDEEELSVCTFRLTGLL